jgi:cytochrome c oxidase subunit 2
MNLTLARASANAWESDALIGGLMIISMAVLLLVFGLIWTYTIRYRASNPIDRGQLGQKSWIFEVTWTSVTMLLFFGLFIWGADLYLRIDIPPGNAMKIYVTGKQWMWKVEHSGGQREINALHVPDDRNVELVMTSEDVIHDFAIPAFRIKHDVLPGRYEMLWFRATLPGTYHLFCTQFCGTDHAAMIGEVVVMSGPDYEQWLNKNATSQTLTESGRALFAQNGCGGCHRAGGVGGTSSARAPSLDGLFGSTVALAGGGTAFVDDRYIHDAITQPESQLVAGFQPVMPSYAGRISEEDLIRLVAYIKSLSAEDQS